MPFARSPGLKKADSRWHNRRIQARKEAFSIDEFSQEDIVRYDLDTARITGSENPRSYLVNPSIDILGEAGIDIRTLDNR